MSVAASQQAPSGSEADADSLSNQLAIEWRIKSGAEHLLNVFDTEGMGAATNEEQGDQLRRQIESELSAANEKIHQLERRLQPTSRPALPSIHGSSLSLPSRGNSATDDQPSVQDTPEHVIKDSTDDVSEEQHAGHSWLDRIARHSDSSSSSASADLLEALEGFGSLMLAQPPLAHSVDPERVATVFVPDTFTHAQSMI